MRDANERLRDGTLPADPFAGARPVRGGNGQRAHAGNGNGSGNHCSDSSDSSEGGWAPPLPIGPSADLPSFPVKTLPLPLADYVDALAESMQVPVDLPAMVVLAVVATAVAGKFELVVRRDWTEQLCLYVVVALPPGERKSPVFRDVVRPIIEFEREHSERLLMDDVTPERLAVFLDEHAGRGSVLSAEGGLFETLRGRYSNGIPAIDVILKGHDGDFVRVDRMTRDSIILDKPALTLGLCVQPDVVQMLTAHPALRGRGLLGRILYSAPKPMLGARKIRATPVDPMVRARYYRTISMLLKFRADIAPAPVELDRGADDVLADFEAKLEARLGPAGDLRPVSDWATKLAGRIARIAALFHLTELAESLTGAASEQPIGLTVGASALTPVGADSMRRALSLADFFVEHALSAYAHMGADERLADAQYLLDVLRALGQRVISRTEIGAQTRGKFRLMKDLRPALDLLVELGWLREAPRPRMSTRGRPPTPEYHLHPSLWRADQSDQSDQSMPAHGRGHA